MLLSHFTDVGTCGQKDKVICLKPVDSGFPGGSDGKRLPTMWETQVWSPGREDPLEKEMATHSSTLAWKIPWTEEPGRLQSMGSQRVGHDWVTSLLFSGLRIWNLNSVLRNSIYSFFTAPNRVQCDMYTRLTSPGGCWCCWVSKLVNAHSCSAELSIFPHILGSVPALKISLHLPTPTLAFQTQHLCSWPWPARDPPSC